MTHREVLLTLFECYCRRVKLNESGVSRLVFNHWGRIARIREGRDFTVGSYERALRWFSDHWPEGLPWPGSIERPPRAGQQGKQNSGQVVVPPSEWKPG